MRQPHSRTVISVEAFISKGNQMKSMVLFVMLGAVLSPRAGRADGRPGFSLQVNHVRLYMTHYALFEEPDPGVPPGIYIDAATGQPTDELSLTPPCEGFQFAADGRAPQHSYVVASADPTKMLPYFVSPPGFPALAPPPEVVGAIGGVLGVTGDPAFMALIAANTTPLLVAIGHFEPTPEPITAQRAGGQLSVTRDVEFQVKVRVGFYFQPPAGVAVPPVGILTGWLTRGLVDYLISISGGSVPPAPNPDELVVYNWRSTMTLSTENQYVRAVATEPRPVADPFPEGMTAIDFAGHRIDDAGGYTIVGSADHVPFAAPPELSLFLFGTTVLNDVEFAVEESGIFVGSGD
jgi:hypothetical protein